MTVTIGRRELLAALGGATIAWPIAVKMSRGFGHVQRKILELITNNPNGAWTIGDLCREIYSRRAVTKARRVAIGRAIAPMKYGTWTFRVFDRKGHLYDRVFDRKGHLYDPCNLDSVRKAHHPRTDKSHFEPGGYIYECVQRAIRYRDGSPLERLTMDIEDAEKWSAYEKVIYGANSPESIERVRQLKEQRDRLSSG